jgi:molybdopterin-guanine dinucleotide biosynthesis protein A
MSRVVSSQIAGVVLAGGRSQRMGGREKALLDLAGQPMLAHVLGRFGPQAGAIAINANGDPARFAAFGLPVIADHTPDHPGPLAGILAGLRWAAGLTLRVSRLATVTSDAPFIPRDLVARLADASDEAGGGIVVAHSGGRLHPVVGLWPLDIADDLERALATGERGVHHWVETKRARVVDFGRLEIAGRAIDPFFNVNTPAELAEAETLMQLLECREAGT